MGGQARRPLASPVAGQGKGLVNDNSLPPLPHVPVRRSAPERGERFAHIDALRGLAALAVAYFHFFGVLTARGDGASILNAAIVRLIVEWIDLGRAAVLLFFIISGYVVARSIRSAPGHHVLRFAIRRLFRLYPMYWVALLFYLAWENTYGAEDIWRNLAMIQVPGWPPRTVISVAWTMTIEVVFYTACAGLFLLGMLQRPSGLAAASGLFLALAAVAALGRVLFAVHIPFEWPLFMSLMFAGALLRELDESGTARPRVILVLAATGYLPIILGLSLLMFWDESIHQKSWYRHFNSYAVAIVAFLAVHYFWRIRSRLLAYLGKISYSIYLLHGAVGGMVVVGLEQTGTDPYLSPHATVGLILLTTVLASAATYHSVEAPFIAIGHRLAGIFGRRPR